MLLVGPKTAGLSLDVPTPLERLGELPLILTTNPNSLRRMVDIELNRAGLRPTVCAEADMLPLLSDLVMAGHGYTLVKAGQLSASPLTGFRITWTIARPMNRNLTLAARKLSDVVVQVARKLIASGAWALADLGGGRNVIAGPPQRSLKAFKKREAKITT